MPSLAAIEARVRTAVEEERYADAEGLLIKFCHAAEAEFLGLSRDDPRGPQLRRQVDDLFVWIGSMARTSRALAQAQLERVSLVRPFLVNEGQEPTLRVEA